MLRRVAAASLTVLRKRKHMVHGLVLAVIAASFAHEGAKLADLAFLSLSVIMELE